MCEYIHVCAIESKLKIHVRTVCLGDEVDMLKLFKIETMICFQ